MAAPNIETNDNEKPCVNAVKVSSTHVPYASPLAPPLRIYDSR